MLKENNSNENQNTQKDEVDIFVSSIGDFVRLPDRDGGSVTYQFSSEKPKRRLVEREFTDKSTGQVTVAQKVEYTVTLPDDPDQGEKKLDTPKTLAQAIEDNLRRGKTLLEIVRHGMGPKTRYNAFAV
jgi:hypothetical protein